MDKQVIKGNIIISLSVSILFFIIIKPFLILLWTFLNSFGITIISKYIDNIYLNAALGHRNWVVVLVLSGVFFLLVLFGSDKLITLMRKKISSKKSKKYINNDKKRKFFKLIFSSIVIIMSFIFGSFLSISIFTDLQLNTSFEQKFTVLLPHISDIESKQFRASWALMETRNDYDKIIEDLNMVANKYGVTLPDPLPFAK